jgi:hypothetical protein
MDYALFSLAYQVDAFMDGKWVVQISIKWTGKGSSRNYKADILITNLISLLQICVQTLIYLDESIISECVWHHCIEVITYK